MKLLGKIYMLFNSKVKLLGSYHCQSCLFRMSTYLSILFLFQVFSSNGIINIYQYSCVSCFILLYSIWFIWWCVFKSKLESIFFRHSGYRYKCQNQKHMNSGVMAYAHLTHKIQPYILCQLKDFSSCFLFCLFFLKILFFPFYSNSVYLVIRFYFPIKFFFLISPHFSVSVKFRIVHLEIISVYFHKCFIASCVV